METECWFCPAVISSFSREYLFTLSAIMSFSLSHTINILERTPEVLTAYLEDLPEFWLHQNEGGETWSPYDVIGHLIVGEKTDWIPRARIILSDSDDKNFTPFDRFAQFNEAPNQPIHELLDDFSRLRHQNIRELISYQLTDSDLEKTGMHPEFGKVSLKQLLATWAVHDLGHISQISRAMAHQYKDQIGPWKQYLSIIKK